MMKQCSEPCPRLAVSYREEVAHRAPCYPTHEGVAPGSVSPQVWAGIPMQRYLPEGGLHCCL